MKLKKHLFTAGLLFTFLLMTKSVLAGVCIVDVERDNLSSSSTLRYIIELLINNRGDNECSSSGSADADYFQKYVAFATEETEPVGVQPVETITLNSVLEFDTRKTVVIGMPSEDAITDPTADVDYDLNDNSYTKENGGTIKDYGMVVIDGQNLIEKPLSCTPESEDAFLRNLIILTNGFLKEDIFVDCIKNGGNTHVCDLAVNDFKEGSDPRTDSDWCTLKDDGSGSSIDIEIDRGSNDLTTVPYKFWYLDQDGDGYGDSDNKVVTYPWQDSFDNGPVGSYVLQSGDCDDDNDTVYPTAPELCDGLDNDCNEIIDDNPVDTLTWYLDSDGDGFGDPDQTMASCEQPQGYVGNDEDCDDSLDTVYPQAQEYCDGLDNDCDEEIDELEEVIDPLTWYEDADQDGYGNANVSTLACEQPEGYVDNDLDCDDTDPESQFDCGNIEMNEGDEPYKESHCSDGLDNDSDGSVDCDDDGCFDAIVCNIPGEGTDPEEACSDSLDNDFDGLIDCDDPGCAETDVCTGEGHGEDPEEECSDEIDNDGDGQIDCDDDSCRGTIACDIEDEGIDEEDKEEECSDGLDSDDDGLIDCDDPGCFNAEACTDPDDGSENTSDECSDGEDNDQDGFADCADPSCDDTEYCQDYNEGTGTDPEAECNDGIDNDGDGLLDCDDVGCENTEACKDIVVDVTDDDTTDDDDDVIDDGTDPDVTSDLDDQVSLAGGAVGGCSCQLTAKSVMSTTSLLQTMLGLVTLAGIFLLRRKAKHS